MTDPFGYDTSYPPELWEAPAAPPVVGVARPADGEVEAGRDELTTELVATPTDADGEALPDAPEGGQAPRTAPARRSGKRSQGRRHDDEKGDE